MLLEYPVYRGINFMLKIYNISFSETQPIQKYLLFFKWNRKNETLHVFDTVVEANDNTLYLPSTCRETN